MMMRRPFASVRILVLSITLFGLNPLLAAPAKGKGDAKFTATEEIDFRRDIRPILSDSCFHCHGPDASTRKAKMRLDTKEGAFAERKGHWPIVPGKPEQSEVIRRLFSTDPDDKMPPPDYPRQPTEKQKELLKKWIAQGAKWQEHWAFEKPEHSEFPKVKNQRWAKNGIDRFILAHLEKNGLKPSSEANKETLIRRVTLDLTGLPPTEEEVKTFLADKSSDAYEKLVDRLLASPRYGERMAVDWLDASRYADTHGFQVDRERVMWPWRDWVIKAYNDNKPFDQFTVEQIAGDLLPDATFEQKIATGFNRNHRINMEAGSIPEEFFIEQVIDRVDTTSTVWLGLTLGCARCHDHKYDPVTSKDFYSMFAFFNNASERGVDRDNVGRYNVVNTKPVFRIPDEGIDKRLAEHDRKLEAKKKAQEKLTKNLLARQGDWEQTIQTKEPTWSEVEIIELKAIGKNLKLSSKEDRSVVAEGQMIDEETYTIVAKTALTNITGIRLEVLPMPDATNKNLGRSASGNFVLSVFKAEVEPISGGKKPFEIRKATATSFRSTFEIEDSTAERANDPGGWSAELKDDEASAVAVYEPKLPIAAEGGAKVTIKLVQNYAGQAQIGRFRLSITDENHPALLTTNLAKVLKTPLEKRRDKDAKTAREYYLSYQPEYRAMTLEMDKLNRERRDIENDYVTTMVMDELEKPREAHILIRGAYDKPGERVFPAVPAVLPQLPANAPTNRLGLARWLASPENPLVARVTVNRYWASYFGHGLVKSIENFGIQGDLPTHPELLNWLATEFIRTGWDIKGFQKLIVMSATYRQASKVTPELLEVDPENLLYARGPRVRLAAEMIRDQALAVSGLINGKVGGPPVKPYQPEGLWEELAAGPEGTGFAKYAMDKGDALYRRSLYIYWKRTVPPPSMATFDAPAREICTVYRSRTSTPLQALALMNDVTYVEAARGLAERMLHEGGSSPDQRIKYAFRLATARLPKAAELKVLQNGLRDRLAEYRANKDAAKQLIEMGESEASQGLDAIELAAYTTVASVILNLDETITKQ